MSDLSTSTRALLDAAKADGPSKLAKAKIWGGVAATTAAAAGGGAAAGSVAAFGSGKLLMFGALFGSAVTVGLAMALMHVGPMSPEITEPRADMQLATPRPVRDPAAPAQPIRAGGPQDDLTVEQDDAPVATPVGNANAGANAAPKAAPAVVVNPAQGAAASKAKAATAKAARTAAEKDDLLERESLLVSEARGALVRGDARAALSAVHAAQALDSHALDPEELSLEARALRAMGSTDAADAVESRLRTRYPDHALAR